MSLRTLFALCFCSLLFLVCPSSAQQAANCSYSFFNFPYPYTNGSYANGINDYGNVVGKSVDASGFDWGFIRYADGTWKEYMAPNASDTWFNARNNAGVTVGTYRDKNTAIHHGLVYYNGKITVVDYPGWPWTELTGINKYGTIVGWAMDYNYNTIGFQLSGGTFTTLSFPGASWTTPYGIANDGAITGDYWDNTARVQRGFVLSKGSYRSIYYPVSGNWTYAGDINNSSTVVGWSWPTNGQSDGQGFRYANGVYKLVDVPGSNQTILSGVNAYGTIAGSAWMPNQGFKPFIAHCQ